jgi:hypothetical protein
VHPFRPLRGFAYRVTATADPTNPASAGRLVATASGADGESAVVVATVRRVVFPGTAPGAIHLATDQAVTSTFLGNAFVIDGNDHDLTGDPGAGGAIPGISTRTDGNAAQAIAGLSAQQADQVRGQGFQAGSPVTPSVMAVPAAPDDAQIDRFVQALLARPRPPDSDVGTIVGGTALGTPETPQISHFTGSLLVGATANVSGGGILIVDGDLDVEGGFDFAGLILVRGRLLVGMAPFLTSPGGRATIYGSVWTQSLELGVGGSALVDYSTQALALATAVAGSEAQPAPLALVALADCGTLPSGSGGCP